MSAADRENPPRPSRLASPAVTSLLVVMLAAAGFGLVQIGGPLPGRRPIDVDDFTAFSIMVGVAVAIWGAIGIGLVERVPRLRELFAPGRPAISVGGLFGIYAACIAAVAVALVTKAGPPPGIPIQRFNLRSAILTVIGLACAGPAVVILWLSTERLRDLRGRLERKEPLDAPAGRIDELQMLWRLSLTAVAALSVTVSATALILGGLRKMLIRYDSEYALYYEEWKLLLLGIFHLIVFAGVYAQTLLSWRGCGHLLVAAIYTTPPDGKPDEAWTQGRARLRQLLGLEGGRLKQLSDAAMVFAPLASSVLIWLAPSFGAQLRKH
jgi:hypothetical protein